MNLSDIDEIERKMARYREKKFKADISKLRETFREEHEPRFGLKYDVPNGSCCYFCLKEKPCMHEHKVRMESPVFGGVKVYSFPYRVCSDCQRKLLSHGILTLLCASLVGVVVGVIFSLFMKLNHPGVDRVIIGICVVCYLVAILSLFNTHGQVRMNILWFFATVLFLVVSGPLILHLFSLSTTLGICSLMALSFPTILIGLYQYINLFSKLYERTVY